jgi:FtsZ-interacting cell division protein ZipA
MTELQMGLIGLGAIAIAAVLAYNKWQESRHRKIAERMMSGQHADILLDEAAAHEPVGDFEERAMHADAAFEAPPGKATLVTRVGGKRVEPAMRVDPHIDEAMDEARQPPAGVISEPSSTHPFPLETPDRQSYRPGNEAAAGHEPKEAGFPFNFLSPIIDYVATFEAIEPASARQIMESQRDFLTRVRKPIYWIGYNEQDNQWESMVAGGQTEFRRLCVGLQLVDRSGPVREGDLSVFHLAMQDLAEELMAVVDLPTRDFVLDTATQLDQFSAGVDIQIGLNVISLGQNFAGTKLRALAEAAGMTFDQQGGFVRRDDEGNVLYRLVDQAETGFSADSVKTMSTHGVTFLLDVPRVAHGDRVFNQMLDLAKRFADALHGSLVDDNRRPLLEGGLEPIRRQVAEYQAAMASRNLPAGGPLALRLFS